MNASAIFLLNLAATWYMVGLIWMVQIVHYNMFDRIGDDKFAAYVADHSRLITPIVMPPMLIELVTACLLLAAAPTGFPRAAALAGLVIVALIWLSTFCLQVPCHTRLATGFDVDVYRRLVSTNWIRTGLWTFRGILMTYYAYRILTPE